MTRTRLLTLLLLVIPVGLLWLCALPLTGPAGIIPGAAAVAAVTVAALARSPRPALAVAVVSLLADAVYSGPPQPAALWAPFEFAALAVLLVSLARRAPVGPTAAVAVAACGLALRTSLHVPGDRVEASVLLVAAAFTATVCAAGAGLWLRLGDHRRRLAEEQARRAHRLDLARDLHDLVAHEVTGIVIAAQAAALPDIEAAGLRALDAMDRMVSTLRGPVSQRVHGLADLPDVVHRFAATGPATATLSMPAVPALSPDASKAAYHVVIEALTNVRRHAPAATAVTVAVTELPGRVELTVVDNGGPEHARPSTSGTAAAQPGNAAVGQGRAQGMTPATPRNGGGTGLAGLQERVSALGGGLAAGPHGSGWQVTCHLPAG